MSSQISMQKQFLFSPNSHHNHLACSKFIKIVFKATFTALGPLYPRQLSLMISMMIIKHAAQISLQPSTQSAFILLFQTSDSLSRNINENIYVDIYVSTLSGSYQHGIIHISSGDYSLYSKFWSKGIFKCTQFQSLVKAK